MTELPFLGELSLCFFFSLYLMIMALMLPTQAHQVLEQISMFRCQGSSFTANLQVTLLFMGIISALPVQVQYEDQKQSTEPDLFKCDDLVLIKNSAETRDPSLSDRQRRNGSGTLHSCPCSVFKAPLTLLHRGPVLPSFPRACEALWISCSRGQEQCVYISEFVGRHHNLNVPLHGTNTPARCTSKSINSGEWCFL